MQLESEERVYQHDEIEEGSFQLGKIKKIKPTR